jgi:hypothetical protein
VIAARSSKINLAVNAYETCHCYRHRWALLWLRMTQDRIRKMRIRVVRRTVLLNLLAASGAWAQERRSIGRPSRPRQQCNPMKAPRTRASFSVTAGR